MRRVLGGGEVNGQADGKIIGVRLESLIQEEARTNVNIFFFAHVAIAETGTVDRVGSGAFSFDLRLL